MVGLEDSAHPTTTTPLAVFYRDETAGSLCALADIHDSAILIQCQMKPLFALDTVQREMIIATTSREVVELFGLIRSAQPAPGAVPQVKNAVMVAGAVEERLRPLKGMVVVLQYDRHSVFLKQRHPVFAIGFAGSLISADSQRSPKRRIGRRMVDNKDVRVIDAERVCDRFVLLAGGRVRGSGTLDELRRRTGQVRAGLEDVFLALT